MATVNYTDLLGLALPTTGDLSGTWGTEVNNYITTYLDSAVSGTQTISGSQIAVTLSKTTAASLAQVGSGSTGSSQYPVINCTGNPASTLTITVSYPSLTNAQFSKAYIVVNATSTSQSVVVRATTSSGTSTGITVASAERCVIVWNGSDFVKTGSTVALPAGSTTQVQYNNGGVLAGSANLTFNGTTLTANDFVDNSLTASKPVFTNASKNLVSTGTVPVDQGGTGLSTATAYGLIAAGTTSTGNFQQVSGTGTSGQVLTSNGAGALPTWQTSSGVTTGKSIAMAMIFGF